jgi:hypothetical protein
VMGDDEGLQRASTRAVKRMDSLPEKSSLPSVFFKHSAKTLFVECLF